MPTTFVKKITLSLLVGIALLLSYPSQADPIHATPSRKEIRQEARLLVLRGKQMQREGKEMLRDGRNMKSEATSKKEARIKRREGRLLMKKGKTLEQQGRLLRRGKISYQAALDCRQSRKAGYWVR